MELICDVSNESFPPQSLLPHPSSNDDAPLLVEGGVAAVAVFAVFAEDNISVDDDSSC